MPAVKLHHMHTNLNDLTDLTDLTDVTRFQPAVYASDVRCHRP